MFATLSRSMQAKRKQTQAVKRFPTKRTMESPKEKASPLQYDQKLTLVKLINENPTILFSSRNMHYFNPYLMT